MNNADSNTYNNAFGAKFRATLPRLLLIPLFTLFLFACSGEENVSGNNTNGFAFPQTEITTAIGNASFTVQASGGSGTGAISYISDKEAIASVDLSSGKITIVAKGTTTIRATREADEIYPQATASLSLTVIDPIASPIGAACNTGEIPTIAAGESGIIDALNIAKDNAGVTVICRYVSVAGAGNKDGISWEHAYGVEHLRTLTDVDDASANKKYIYLVKAGTYTPADENGSRETSFSLKKHVAITGGWSGTAFELGEKTIFSGDLNGDDDADDKADNSYHVFKHADADATSVDNSAILYGVTISAGNADGGGQASKGGGMLNSSNSNPVVSNTSFSNNSAASNGGGMYNSFGSSPVVSNTSFSNNSAASNGGGMYNFNHSNPVVSNTSFSNNGAKKGGGMYNIDDSNPVVSNTSFSGNSAAQYGGGMYNYSSHPVVSNTTFSGNTAENGGGGMYNEYSHPVVSNSIFWGNTAPSGNQIYIFDDYYEASGISLGNVVLEGGINVIGKSEGVISANIKHNNIIENDPKLRDLDNNGGFVQTMALGDGSSAINKGLYIKRAADNRTYYYSEDNTTWYHTPLLDMAEGESGDEVVDGEVDSGVLLDKDARGYLHQGKPDIGAYESQGGP